MSQTVTIEGVETELWTKAELDAASAAARRDEAAKTKTAQERAKAAEEALTAAKSEHETAQAKMTETLTAREKSAKRYEVIKQLTKAGLTPEQAIAVHKTAAKKGDFSTPEKITETLEKLKTKHPEVFVEKPVEKPAPPARLGNLPPADKKAAQLTEAEISAMTPGELAKLYKEDKSKFLSALVID